MPIKLDWLPSSFIQLHDLVRRQDLVIEKFTSVIPNVGTVIATAFKAKSSHILTEFQEQFQSNVQLEEDNSVTLWCTQADKARVIAALRGLIDRQREVLVRECLEIPLGDKGSRLLIQAGGAVLQHLTPKETVRISVKNIPLSVLSDPLQGGVRDIPSSETTVRDWLFRRFSKYGHIAETVGYVDAPADQCWGQVLFTKPSNAKEAMGENGSILSGKSCIVNPIRRAEEASSSSVYYTSGCSVLLRWTLGRPTGKALLTFTPQVDPRYNDAAKVASLGQIYIHQNIVSLVLQPGEKVLLTNVPPSADEEDIKAAIHQRYPKIRLFANVVYEKRNDGEEDEEGEEAQLRSALTQFGLFEDFTRSLPENSIVRGYVHYSDPDVARRVAVAVNNQVGIIGTGKIRANVSFLKTVTVHKEIYSLFQKSVDDLVAVIKKEGKVKVNLKDRKTSRGGEIFIKVEGEDPGAAEAAWNRISNLDCLKGTPLVPRQDAYKLVLDGGAPTFLLSLMKEHGVFIHWDKRKIFVTVFGQPVQVEASQRKAEEFLRNLANLKTQSIALQPLGIKALIGKRGTDFAKLVEKYPGLSQLKLDLKARAVVLVGLPNLVDAAAREVQGILDQVGTSHRRASPAAATEDCPICFCDVDADQYRLACGHSFCTPCLRSQLLSADKTPISCVKCDQPLILRDLAQLTAGKEDNFNMDRLTKIAVSTYLGNHHTTVAPCIGLDCIGLLDISQGNTKCQCHECQKDYCLECQGDGHDGPCICPMCKGKHPGQPCTAGDNSFLEALAQMGGKKCPRCSVPILKNGGCNAITCTRCHAGFCYLCGKDCGSDAHPHFGEPGICNGKLFTGLGGAYD